MTSSLGTYNAPLRWGLSATIKAPATDILAFAAHHIELGAHRLYIYLDEANPEAFAHLKAHPKIRVTTCDDNYWRQRGSKRPRKHQVRQTVNATHAYARTPEVDWLIHIDVDEYLWPDSTIFEALGALPDHVRCARVRPMESLSGDGIAFKAFIPGGPKRQKIVEDLYPVYGTHVRGGFLSHLPGKLFVRSGINGLDVRIHNVFLGEQMNPDGVELATVALCHCHANNWEDWIAAYRFRLEQGSYRADLSTAFPRVQGGMTLHELFQSIEAEQGEPGLRAFHDELCADTPQLRKRLKAAGLLRLCDLQLDSKRWKHFPDSR